MQENTKKVSRSRSLAIAHACLGNWPKQVGYAGPSNIGRVSWERYWLVVKRYKFMFSYLDPFTIRNKKLLKPFSYEKQFSDDSHKFSKRYNAQTKIAAKTVVQLFFASQNVMFDD